MGCNEELTPRASAGRAGLQVLRDAAASGFCEVLGRVGGMVDGWASLNPAPLTAALLHNIV